MSEDMDKDVQKRKRLQQCKLEELREDLKSNKPLKIEEIYYICTYHCQMKKAHSGHPTSQHTGFGQHIHPLMIKQITDLA